MKQKEFPRFFIVDGLPVKVVAEGDEVAGYTYSGIEYPPLKALNEGREVSEKDYDDAVSDLSTQ